MKTAAPPAAAGAMAVQYIKGVGPKMAEKLAMLGVSTVADLLYYYPRAYDDRTRNLPIRSVRAGEAVSVRGQVRLFEEMSLNRALSLGRALIADSSGSMWAQWFRRKSYRYDVFAKLKKEMVPGAPVMVYGKAEWGRGGLHIAVDEYEMLGGGDTLPIHMNRIVPIYPLTEGLSPRWMRETVWRALEAALPAVQDLWPADFVRAHDLAERTFALREIHFPSSEENRKLAHRRLAFEEFFYLELALAAARSRRAVGPPAFPCAPQKKYLTPFRQSLGFEFTAGQKRAINEIFEDMAGARPMNRLLQGDVGCGKTIVALSAMLLAAENGRQSALMAPTEILAEQHARTLEKYLQPLGVAPVLLTSSTSVKQRKKILEDVQSGAAQVLVGTQALIQDRVIFKEAALVVIDEQHRFGVRQRATLQQKSGAPHVLMMTATPIPRTLAMTLYGDLSVSTIEEKPPGRPALTTHWTLEENAWTAVRREVAAGRQAFIVFPLVEESEKIDLKAVLVEWEKLKARTFPGFTVGLLHGRMKAAEKEATMARFKAGAIQVLAATPVIEVGIDIPNATVMVICEADRFGVAQLHQLRGRVGRGAHPSACYLVSRAASPASVERLKLLCQTNDGFRLAEEDLKFRGPGEFLGEAQHGLLPLKLGDLITDGPLIEEAQKAAFAVFEQDPDLSRPAHRIFQAELKERFGARLHLGRVG